MPDIPRRRKSTYDDSMPLGLKIIFGAIIVFLVFLVLGAIGRSFWQVIPAGHVGVSETFGKVNPFVSSSGLVFPKSPFTKFHLYNMRLQKLNIDNLEASDIDGQLVYADIVINFKLKDKESARKILLNVGKPNEYVQIMALEEKTNQGFKQTITQYKALEVLEKRTEVSNKARDNIYERLPTELLDVESINIVDIRFTEKFDQAIERKKVAEQEALASEREVAVAQAEAQKSIAKAEGEKQVRILQAEAEAQENLVKAQAEAEALRLQREEISPLVLELRKIEAQVKLYEAWNGELPQFVGGDSIPLLNLNDMFKSKSVSSGGG